MESVRQPPFIGRKHKLTEYSVIESGLLHEHEIFYNNITTIEHLAQNGERFTIRLHRKDQQPITFKQVPNSLITELSNRI